MKTVLILLLIMVVITFMVLMWACLKAGSDADDLAEIDLGDLQDED